jgi:hypothetical protein
MKKETIIQAALIIIAIIAFALGIYFIVQLVNGPDSGKKTEEAIMSGELKTYTHPDYGLTFNYPANFKLGKFPEGEGEVILVQSEDGKQGFQIFISLYQEKNPLSKAIIQQSAPDLKISNDQEIEIGAGKIQALSFDSAGTSGGDTHEIWFVVEGNLYQISSFPDFGGRMEEIIKSLRFN